MKRKMISLLTILFVLTISVLPVSAASPRLADEAGLLSNAECAAIEKQLDELSTQYGLDVVIVTTDSTGSSTPMEYADDYFDYNDYTPDGVLLLVSMEERDWWISTAGFGIQAFTDAGIAYIGDQIVPYLSGLYPHRTVKNHGFRFTGSVYFTDSVIGQFSVFIKRVIRYD